MSSAGKFANDLYGNTTQVSAYTNTAIVYIRLSQGKSVTLTEGEKLDVTGMSSEQFKKFLELLNNAKIKN